jgi:hypothetical protein
LIKILSSSLFLVRTLFIFLGLAGIFLGIRNHFYQFRFWILILGYMITWYFFLSFFYRNMEIRYLLPCDVLLLIPASYVFFPLLIPNKKKASRRYE